MLATQALQGAMASDTYVCGMQPLDQDHPLHNVFVCDSQLTCDQVVEPTFYSSGNKRRKTYDGDADVNVEPMLCAVCAGMSMDPDGGFIDDKLATVFNTLLPICQTCLNNNEKYYARGYQREWQTDAACTRAGKKARGNDLKPAAAAGRVADN